MPVKVLICVRSFFAKRVGALSRVAVELALAMNGAGIETHILTDDNGSPANRDWYQDAVTVFTVPATSIMQTSRQFKQFAADNGYTRFFIHCSLLGLVVFLLGVRFRPPKGFYALLYTRRPRWKDFSLILPREFLTHSSRIFRRNFVYAALVPGPLVRKALAMPETVFTPSRELFTHYARLTPRAKAVALGTDNSFVAPESQEEDRLAQELRAHREAGRTVIVHSGLATPFRGWSYAVDLVDALDRDDVVLYLLLYADPGEHIGPQEIEKANLRTRPGRVVLINRPLRNLNGIFEATDLALYFYRYLGDIPECPLTVSELQSAGAVVLANRLGGLDSMLVTGLPVLTGDLADDLRILGETLDNLDAYKALVREAVDNRRLPTWRGMADAIFREMSIP